MDEHVFMIKSRITHKEYNAFETCRILNLQQAIRYLANHVELIDLYTSKDKDNPGVQKLVFVFDRKESKWAYDLWCKRELGFPEDDTDEGV